MTESYCDQKTRETIAKGEKALTKASFKVMKSLLNCALRYRNWKYSGEGEFLRIALCEPSHTYFDTFRIVNILECSDKNAYRALHFLAEEGFLWEGECGGEYVYRFR